VVENERGKKRGEKFVKIFELRSRVPGNPLRLRLVQQNGDTDIDYADDIIRPDAEKWIQFGLSEWINQGIHATPRSTYPQHSKFLPRLKDYLDRQFNFIITVEEQ
jgi:hypothetical protein